MAEDWLMKWSMALLAILGGFFTAGIVGGMTASLAGFWDMPGAGFSAAFAVVLVTYWAAPSRKPLSSALVFCAGALVAWFLLEPSFYPEYPARYREVAYERTRLPLLATWLGGVLGLAVVLGIRRRSTSRDFL
jgi:hypothetical protein